VYRPTRWREKCTAQAWGAGNLFLGGGGVPPKSGEGRSHGGSQATWRKALRLKTCPQDAMAAKGADPHGS
jgi:hypothetical protein